MPWLQASGGVGLLVVALTASVAVGARALPTEDDKGKADVIELAAIETSTQSEAQDASTAAPEQIEEARRHIDEVKAQKIPDDQPQEQASPEAPQDDLRMAQEKTKETVENATPDQQATEAQQEKAVTAPPSQASIAAEQSQAIDGTPKDETSTAQDIGSTKDGARRMGEWQKKLFSHIARHKYYPQEARKRGDKGEVVVAFALDPQGGVASARILKSSGSKALDDAALDVMRKASPVPQPPSGAIELALPLRFSLK